MRAFAFILPLLCPSLAFSSAALASAESDAFALFQQACIHDESQFDSAMTLSSERGLVVAPQLLRDAIVRKGEGAAWLTRSQPHVLLHANMEAGCGVMLKPAGDEGFYSIVEALPGVDLVVKDAFETSWSRWYYLERSKDRGILMTGLMDVSGSKSAFLRYLPGKYVLDHDEAMAFLLTDFRQFGQLRIRLRKK